jgi:hypothetical protein
MNTEDMRNDLKKTLLGKISDLPKLQALIATWKKEGRKVVFTMSIQFICLIKGRVLENCYRKRDKRLL